MPADITQSAVASPLEPNPPSANVGPHGPLPNLRYLSKGTFGAIYERPGKGVVEKIVECEENNAALMVEFDLYPSVNTALSLPLQSSSSIRDPRATFLTPQPSTYFCPRSSTIPARAILASPPSPTTTSSSSSASALLSPEYLAETLSAEYDGVPFASMSMSLIRPLPDRITKLYRDQFWRDQLYSSGPPIRLLRLYFGRSFPETSSQIAPGIQADPPLDITRYNLLDQALKSSSEGMDSGNGSADASGAEGLSGLPSLQDVAWGMGEVLAKLHWEVGTNGRDIELVLGGEEARVWVLDYNQSQPWLISQLLKRAAQGEHLESYTTAAYASNSLPEAAGRLGVLIGTQEYYYPRPDSPPLYARLKAGYMCTVDVLLAYHSPSAPREPWSAFSAEVKEAAENFFVKYEKVSAARAERAARKAMSSRASRGQLCRVRKSGGCVEQKARCTT